MLTLRVNKSLGFKFSMCCVIVVLYPRKSLGRTNGRFTSNDTEELSRDRLIQSPRDWSRTEQKSLVNCVKTCRVGVLQPSFMILGIVIIWISDLQGWNGMFWVCVNGALRRVCTNHQWLIYLEWSMLASYLINWGCNPFLVYLMVLSLPNPRPLQVVHDCQVMFGLIYTKCLRLWLRCTNSGWFGTHFVSPSNLKYTHTQF